MKRTAFLFLVAVNAFVICDWWYLAPHESLLFKQHVRDRLRVVWKRVGNYLRPEGERTSPITDTSNRQARESGGSIAENRFVAPRIESLEALTQDWTHLPDRVFPRSVVLRESCVFSLSGGKVELPAGSAVLAISFDGGNLVLAPSSSSQARCSTKIGSTDLRDQILSSYQLWHDQQMAIAKAQWERSQSLRAQEVEVGTTHESSRPIQSADGSYAILIESMRRGDVLAITPKKVKRWHAPQLLMIEGRPTWTVDVTYSATVFCGEVDAVAQAHFGAGKVVKWIYPGSGEPVP
ncbi:MAG: hypothetical protein JNJ83_21110 [Verrucomicrobiaceae bacterium]|nr:hypothetical protein [Verrucomicrobiaceae bacterium]